MQRQCSVSNTKNLVSLDKMFLSPRPCAPSRSMVVSFSACDESLESLSAVRKRNDKEILFFHVREACKMFRKQAEHPLQLMGNEGRDSTNSNIKNLSNIRAARDRSQP